MFVLKQGSPIETQQRGDQTSSKSMGSFWKEFFSKSALFCLGNRLMIDEGNVSETCLQQPDFSTSFFPTFF